MKRNILIYVLLFVFLTGCARQCTSCNRKYEVGNRTYEIVMYSGGDTVFYDKFTGIINDAEGSDGCYYYKRDTLIEISGDYILKSTN